MSKQKTTLVIDRGFGNSLANFIIAAFLIVVAFVSLVPMWHVLMSSISDGKQLLAHEGLVLLPVGNATVDGYKIMFADLSILKGYLNTITYVLGATFFSVLFNTLGGYVLSRDVRMKGILTIFVTFTMLFNGG